MRKALVAVLTLGILAGALVGGGVAIVLSGGGKSQSAATDVPASMSVTPAPNSGGESSATAADVSATEPRASIAPESTAPQLIIVALKRSMLEVRSSKGDKYVRRTFNPGEVFMTRVGAGFTVSADDGSAFELRLGDHSLGLLQPEGGPVYLQKVDMAAERPPIAMPSR